MQILNSPDFLRDYPKQLEQSMYGIFAIFRDKGSNVLSV